MFEFIKKLNQAKPEAKYHEHGGWLWAFLAVWTFLVTDGTNLLHVDHPIDSGIGGLMVLGLLVLGKIDRMSNAFRMMFNK